MSSADSIRTSLVRWYTARRAVLGAVILAGSVVTSTSLLARIGARDCGLQQHRIERTYTYSGIGVVIEQRGDEAFVRRVLRDAPASGMLHPGARLVSVDGQTLHSAEAWATAIRGAPGTSTTLEIAGPCGGHKTLSITRDIIRKAY